MKILTINCGSSSLKFQLIDMADESVIAKGLCDRIGISGSYIKYTKDDLDPIEKNVEMKDHTEALKILVKLLTDDKLGVIKSMEEITAVGHRVVHGAEKFTGSALIDENVMKTIEECIEIAPLHNPPNITGINACKSFMPATPMVAVFDTAFHQSMPKNAFMYALPYESYKDYGIRRYGFHGTSHKFVGQRAAELLGKPFEESKIITCHLGNGSSITAISNGKSVDTSMGFTPLEGLPMGSRCGSIDPAIVTYIMERENIGYKEINDYMNKKSGVLGISGVSSDFRDLHVAENQGNERAGLAIDIFCYNVKKYIGEYMAVLNGADAVCFTAGIGENNSIVRRKSISGLENLGICLDIEKNEIKGQEVVISTPDSKVKIFVIPTNEELAIARETAAIIQ